MGKQHRSVITTTNGSFTVQFHEGPGYVRRLLEILGLWGPRKHLASVSSNQGYYSARIFTHPDEDTFRLRFIVELPVSPVGVVPRVGDGILLGEGVNSWDIKSFTITPTIDSDLTGLPGAIFDITAVVNVFDITSAIRAAILLMDRCLLLKIEHEQTALTQEE